MFKQRSAILAIWVLAIVASYPNLAAAASVNDLLFVVKNAANLTNSEDTRKAWFEANGYTVTVIDDGDTQANFDAKAALNNVAWISSDVAAGTLSTKLKNTTIGVVCEDKDTADEFAFSDTSKSSHNKNFLDIKDNTHYITYGLSLGNLTILTTNESMARRSGTLAGGAVNLASVEYSSGNTGPALLVIDTGGALYGSGTAAGRRVLLPIGGPGFTIASLNANGWAIFLRAIEWAAKPTTTQGNILFPVANTSSLTAQETLKKMQLEVWGYNVTTIDDDASAASYTTAFSGKLAVYVTKDISAASLSTKLTSATIGVVSEVYGLSDELGMSSTSTSSSATAITIAENKHYIVSALSTGSLTIFTSSQPAATLTGTIAPGLQTLGTISSAKSLGVVETGAVLSNSTVAAGRRVQLPWGSSSFDYNAVNGMGKKIMRRAIEWAATGSGTRVLMVVANSSSLTTDELARKTLLESWNYSVNIIDDDASQANINLALAANSVAYVPETISASSLGTKLYSAKIGVVNEEPGEVTSLGIATTQSNSSQSSLTITEANHYITSSLGTGTFTIYTSSQNSTLLTGTFASGSAVLGNWGSTRALVTIEAGATLTDSTAAAGRRVQLPWGGSGFSISNLNSNGQTILQRSLKWGGGLVGHWKFDETTGTSASDSSTYGHTGTLSGSMTFPGSTTVGKVGNALNFNGSSHYVTANNSSALQITSAMTITAWIKGDTWGSGSTVNTILRKGDANPNNYQLAIASSRLEAVLDGNDNAGYKGNTTLLGGQWYHVAMAWDGTQVRLYVNGVLDNSPVPSKSAPIGTDTRALYMGGRIGSTDFFDGLLDDVRLYNYALGSAEIARIKGIGGMGIRVTKWKEVK